MFFPMFRLALVAVWAVAATPAPAQQPDLFDQERGLLTIAPIIEAVSDAVVNVSVVSQQPMRLNPLFNDPFFREFFDFSPRLQPRPQLSAGSGVIIDAENGYVLTNNHVVEAASEITVTLTDKRNITAEVIGTDPATDIAVLRIDADALTKIEMGNSDHLQVGDFVVALGNPFGLGQTVTSGIVSALGRSGINPEGYEDFIQTDASINPGNSGGALITLDGRLIGINSAIIAPAGGNVGIGFAVPINLARGVMEQLVAYGEVRRGQLGVMIQDLTPDLAQALGIEAEGGAIISQVVPGSAAAAAGLTVGDVIVAVDGTRIEGSGDLRNLIGMTQPGRSVTLSVLREGRSLSVRALIGKRRPSGRTGSGTGAEGTAVEALDGAVLADLGPGMPGYGEAEGIAILSVTQGSPASRAGLREGDVITAVNTTSVATVGDLIAALEGAGTGPKALSVYRDGAVIYVVIG